MRAHGPWSHSATDGRPTATPPRGGWQSSSVVPYRATPGTVEYHRSVSLSFRPHIGEMSIVFISLLSYVKVRQALGYGGVGGVVGAKGRRDPLLQIGRRQQESGEEWDGAQAA
jgi:hypothetical protein